MSPHWLAKDPFACIESDGRLCWYDHVNLLLPSADTAEQDQWFAWEGGKWRSQIHARVSKELRGPAWFENGDFPGLVSHGSIALSQVALRTTAQFELCVSSA